MPDDEGGRARSGFMAFWTSLPGVLTGVAGVIAAVAALGGLFVDDGGSGASAGQAAPPPVVETPDSTVAAGDSAAGETGCFARYFAGIPPDRVAPVESGTTAFDVITADQSKSGSVGLRFTAYGRDIGGMRFALFPRNNVFKVESVVDASCRPVEDYENLLTDADKHVVADSTPLRVRLAGNSYDLNLTNGGTGIRLNFVPVVP